MKWRAWPIDIKRARPYLARWHRRRKTCHAARFAVAVKGDGVVRGVAFCGNPVATQIDMETTDGRFILEVVRLATDGTPNACTRVQAVIDRTCRAMGYTDLITYTDPEECGASLRAAGWRGPTLTKGGTRGNRPGRNPEKQPPRWRWDRRIAGPHEITTTEGSEA